MKIPVFSTALFLSAGAMFALQPMAGKMLLPLVGGTPAGWVVAMAFFQIMLLAGYFLAHAFSRFPARTHGALYLAAMGAGFVFLPVSLASHAGLIRGTPGPVDIFLLLFVAVSVPFIALSATSSTLQRLFGTTGHPSAKDPYFLYAASNLGSFAGLFAYPLLIEPNLSLTAQSEGWRVAYALLALLAALCLALSGKSAGTSIEDKGPPVGWKRRAEWTVLAFFPSSLLLGVTTFITTDICSIPLLWVLPLGLYLLTFVAAFRTKPLIPLRILETVLPFAVAATIILLLAQGGLLRATFRMLPLILLSFSAVALYCHTRLAAARPPGGRLTEFYLFLSIGGALGGILNAFIIPNVLERAIEYPLALLAVLALHPDVGWRTKAGRVLLLLVGAAFLLQGFEAPRLPLNYAMVHIALIMFVISLMILPEKALAVGMAVILLISEFALGRGAGMTTTRNFFGVIKVYDGAIEAGGKKIPMRYMQHGTTMHGYQMMDEAHARLPTSYFSRKGPLGGIFDYFQPKDVGVIGLGAGTINCHAAPDRAFTFIEIDPDIIAAAQDRFTFLSACKSRKAPRLIEGDGRLELAKLDDKFDLFIIDAFSSDMIPTHLLTAEAMKVYFDHIKPGGVLAIHISNRYFRLHSAIRATAQSMDIETRYLSRMTGIEPWGSKSVWVVAATKGTDLNAFARAQGWSEIPANPGMKPWTDDYTNLVSTLYLEKW